MRRKVATLAGLVILVAVSWTAVPVQASCANSTLQVAVPPIVFGNAITVAWQIAPACDVIETGLLLGPDPASLVPVGDVFYGLRDFYFQRIPITRSGQLWIAARARDEDGRVIQSSPQPVQIMVPPAGVGDPAGTGAPLSFTGTDADFLQPAGNPHFASLRKVTSTEVSLATLDSAPTFVGGSRLAASPHAPEVRAEVAGITTGGMGFPSDPRSLDDAFAAWNALFQQFPRTGLYSVLCGVGVTLPTTVTHAGCGPTEPFVEYLEQSLSFISPPSPFQPAKAVGAKDSIRSTLIYFIPKAPAGQQVQRATLSAMISAVGDLSTLRLNGKPPVARSQVGHCQLPCTLSATWDFTSEVQALAAQGGGELPLTVDPIAPVVQPTFAAAFWRFSPAVNYPWAPGNPNNSLVITFGAACPPLTLTAMGQSVRPQLPPPPMTTFTEAVTNAATESTIKADVCLPGSASNNVKVNLEVRPPSPGSPDKAGGHVHDGVRVQCTGTFTQPRAGTALGGCVVVTQAASSGAATASCIATLDAQGKGSCTVTYFPFFVSGVETIAACISSPCKPGSADAQTKITVEVPGLQRLAEAFQNLPPQLRPFLLTGQTMEHPDNHWGTQDTPGMNGTLTAIREIALAYYLVTGGTTSGATLGINDMSLRQGGLFDICGTWNPTGTCARAPNGGHKAHRTGTSVDIDLRACRDPGLRQLCGSNMSGGPTVPTDRRLIEGLCNLLEGSLAEEKPLQSGLKPIHCELSR